MTDGITKRACGCSLGRSSRGESFPKGALPGAVRSSARLGTSRAIGRLPEGAHPAKPSAPSLYDGKGNDDLRWSALGGGSGEMSAEVEIAYSGKSAEGANECEVRAVGGHGAVSRTFTATIEHPGEGRE